MNTVPDPKLDPVTVEGREKKWYKAHFYIIRSMDKIRIWVLDKIMISM